MTFDDKWKRIVEHAGEEFFTVKHISFRYKITNNCVVPDRTNYPISKINFQKAENIELLKGPGQINNLVIGPSYVFSILTDKRIVG